MGILNAKTVLEFLPPNIKLILIHKIVVSKYYIFFGLYSHPTWMWLAIKPDAIAYFVCMSVCMHAYVYLNRVHA